jgi:hypothetical protein
MHMPITAMSQRILLIALSLVLGCAACSPLGIFAATPTPTLTHTATFTFTPSLTDTPSSTFTFTPSLTPTETFTLTPSITPTETLTATITLTPSRTRIPSRTQTPVLPRVSILELSSCRYGPGSGYLFFTGLGATAWEDVVGRMEILARKTGGGWGPSEWLFVESISHDPSTRCWVKASLTKVIRGDINTVPDYTDKPKAPYLYGASDLYTPVQAVSAQREGNFVDVYWGSVYMTEDDYRGYLIEAWVCYQGHFYFAPVGFAGSFKENAGMGTNVLSIPDEPGCSQPSHAQIFLAEKHGFSRGTIIPWPALPTVPAPTETLTETPTEIPSATP